MASPDDVSSDGADVTRARPLTHAERQARYMARKKAARSATADVAKPPRLKPVPPHEPFGPGNLVAVRHGAYSGRLTGPRAQEITAGFLSSPACPPDAREDPVLMDAIIAWAEAVAEVERLRDYRNVLEAQLGDDAVAEMMTEETQIRETEVRPPGSTMTRDSLTRTRESTVRALYRAEMKARTMRNDLWKRLAVHNAGRKGPSLALIMARMDDEEQADGTG